MTTTFVHFRTSGVYSRLSSDSSGNPVIDTDAATPTGGDNDGRVTETDKEIIESMGKCASVLDDLDFDDDDDDSVCGGHRGRMNTDNSK